MINWFHFLVKGVRIVFRSKEKFGSREKKIVERIKQIQSAKDRSSFEDEGFRVAERRFSKRVARPVKEIWQASRIVSNV